MEEKLQYDTEIWRFNEKAIFWIPKIISYYAMNIFQHGIQLFDILSTNSH